MHKTKQHKKEGFYEEDVCMHNHGPDHIYGMFLPTETGGCAGS
jgi:hypothetical protein